MPHALQYEINPVDADGGGLRFELRVEGQSIAVASAAAEVLDAMVATLGMSPAEVAASLRGALIDHLSHRLAQVTVEAPRADPPGSLRFVSRFTLREGDSISTGVVWYDVESSETGPDAVPALVRNRMRYEVHRALTDEGSHARALVELMQPLAS
jgi:hypothetical protein